MTVTALPLLAICVARRTAAVVFPTPPLGLIKEMVGMEGSLERKRKKEGYLGNDQIPKAYWIAF
jgi:hypothetical protein